MMMKSTIFKSGEQRLHAPRHISASHGQLMKAMHATAKLLSPCKYAIKMAQTNNTYVTRPLSERRSYSL
jgi:hypothetical protein